MERHLTLTERIQRVRPAILEAAGVADGKHVDVAVEVRAGDRSWDVDGVAWPGLGLVILAGDELLHARWLGAVDDDAIARLADWLDRAAVSAEEAA